MAGPWTAAGNRRPGSHGVFGDATGIPWCFILRDARWRFILRDVSSKDVTRLIKREYRMLVRIGNEQRAVGCISDGPSPWNEKVIT